jgi:ATP:ADP antiporter, AAA family
MAEGLVGTVQYKSQEQKQITLMLATGFFMGVFIATYQVTADSLFLNRLGDQLKPSLLLELSESSPPRSFRFFKTG